MFSPVTVYQSNSCNYLIRWDKRRVWPDWGPNAAIMSLAELRSLQGNSERSIQQLISFINSILCSRDQITQRPGTLLVTLRRHSVSAAGVIHVFAGVLSHCACWYHRGGRVRRAEWNPNEGVAPSERKATPAADSQMQFNQTPAETHTFLFRLHTSKVSPLDSRYKLEDCLYRDVCGAL